MKTSRDTKQECNIETYAVLRRNHHCKDEYELAKAIAKAFGGQPADHRRLMATRRGVVATGLTEANARSLKQLCLALDMDVVALPGDDIVNLPDPIAVRTLRPEDAGCQILNEMSDDPDQPETIPWGNFLWLDLLPIRTTVEKEVRELDLVSNRSEGREGPHFAMTTQRRQAVERSTSLDFVTNSSESGLRYWRVDSTRCRFRDTGLQVHAITAKNMEAIAIALASRATAAVLGSGLARVRGGPREKIQPFDAEMSYSWAETQATIALA